MSDYYLKKRLVIGIIAVFFICFVVIRMWRGKNVLKGKQVELKNVIVKILYTRIIPMFFVIGICSLMLNPFLDIIDPNKYTYSDSGVLNGISASSQGSLGEYTITLGKKTYRVPKSLKEHSQLTKGELYKVNYYKNSRIVYNIEIVQTQKDNPKVPKQTN